MSRRQAFMQSCLPRLGQSSLSRPRAEDLASTLVTISVMRPKKGTHLVAFFGAEQSLAQPQNKQIQRTSYSTLVATTGNTLRTYRLALAATAEFTQQYGGGTVAGALGALTTTINAVNAIYERDLAIHLMLVTNETSIIFTNPVTD